MSGRFVRHNIVGSETHAPRPIAYLTRTGRRRRGRSRALGWLALALLLAAGVVAALASG